MPSPGHVRLDDILRVCSSGGHVNYDLLRELLVLFIQENDRRIQAAMAAADQGDARALCGALHALKGSAGLIGAEHLQNLASEGEARIVSGTLGNLRACARQLSDEYSAVVSTLRTLYPDLCAAP